MKIGKKNYRTVGPNQAVEVKVDNIDRYALSLIEAKKEDGRKKIPPSIFFDRGISGREQEYKKPANEFSQLK